MTDTDKFRRGEVPPEQEDALESVAGGKFERANYDLEQNELKFKCPVCGNTVKSSFADGWRLHCPECGHQFRFDGSTLVEE